MSIYAQPKMQAVLDQTPKPRRFLTDMFFGNVEFVSDKSIAFDIVDGKRKLAPWVHSRIGRKLVEDSGYQTKEYKAAETSPYKTIDPEDLLERIAGEAISGSGVLSPEQRERRLATKKLLELEDMVENLIEFSGAQALFYGKVDVNGEGISETVTYWPQAGAPYKALAGAALWSAPTTAVPEDDFEFAKTAISKAGLTMNVAILGENAWKNLRKNEAVRKDLELENYQVGSIDSKDMPEGAIFRGRLYGVDLYTYGESYFDEATETEVPYVPVDRVLFASTKARTTLAFQMVYYEDPRKESIQWYLNRLTPYSKVEDGLGRMIQVKSRPLPIINQIRGFYVMKVV